MTEINSDPHENSNSYIQDIFSMQENAELFVSQASDLNHWH
jgi:hypothetical protein